MRNRNFLGQQFDPTRLISPIDPYTGLPTGHSSPTTAQIEDSITYLEGVAKKAAASIANYNESAKKGAQKGYEVIADVALKLSAEETRKWEGAQEGLSSLRWTLAEKKAAAKLLKELPKEGPAYGPDPSRYGTRPSAKPRPNVPSVDRRPAAQPTPAPAPQPAPAAPPTPVPQPTSSQSRAQDCPPGEIPDGRGGCRGSVASGGNWQQYAGASGGQNVASPGAGAALQPTSGGGSGGSGGGDTYDPSKGMVASLGAVQVRNIAGIGRSMWS